MQSVLNEDSGQGITEYGAFIAFIALLTATVFSVTHGSLAPIASSLLSAAVHQSNNPRVTAANTP